MKGTAILNLNAGEKYPQFSRPYYISDFFFFFLKGTVEYSCSILLKGSPAAEHSVAGRG